jgi:oligopeptide transport system ATP-binding protein
VDIIKDLRRELGMAIIWITHDLGIVAGLVDRVQVMYAGYVVERAPVRDFYANPRHPYSRGLIGSLPRLDEDVRTKLTPIEGLPPDLIDMPPGCPYLARCNYRVPRCMEQNPPLRSAGTDHLAACWVDL